LHTSEFFTGSPSTLASTQLRTFVHQRSLMAADFSINDPKSFNT